MTHTRTLILVVLGLIPLAGLSPALADYPTEVMSDGPIGYWRLGESSGAAQAQDETTNNRDLDYNGFAAGDYGQTGAIAGDADTAMNFASAKPNDTLLSPNAADFGFASGQSFSLEYWIKTPGSGNAGVITKGYSTSEVRPWYLARYDSHRVDFYLRNAAGTSRVATSSTRLNDDQWHHVVGVYDNSNSQVRIYVDGSMEDRATSVPLEAYGTNAAVFTVANHANRVFDGQLDEVAVYEKALDNTDGSGGVDSYTRVLEHYLTGTGFTAGPTLNVDFSSSINEGGGPGGVQDQFLSFDGTEDDGSGNVTRTYPSTMGSGGTVDVTIGGYTHFRDYAAITGGPFAGQNELLSDMVLRNAGGTMTLTLADLGAGLYDITTYHHSPSSGGGTIDINLTDANGSSSVGTGIPVSNGTSPASISTVSFQFESNGSSVAIDFVGGSGAQHASLNGFELTLVPEPSTFALSALGLLGLLACGQRRKR